MTEEQQILEEHVFISDRKEREVYSTVLEKIMTFSIDSIDISYVDQPDESFSNLNERTKKILTNLPKPEKIECFSGTFADGGSFRLQNGNLHVSVREDEYNYELVDSLKNFLGPVFPLWIFRNPYIWGATICEDYDRQHFFDSRNFSVRSRRLEDPEIDIYRRDNNIIYKFRFFTKEEFELEEGMRAIAGHFKEMRAGLQKRNYEGLEVFNLYCTDKPTFRKFEPRTKMGKEIKSILPID